MTRKTKRWSFHHTYREEATLLKKTIAWLETQPDLEVLRICDRYHIGYSDLFICVRGIFVVAELKDDTGTPSIHQKDFVNRMLRCGAIGKVDCRTVQDVINLVEAARERHNRS